MKSHIQDAQVVCGLVTPQHLDGDDERVLEQVAVGEGGGAVSLESELSAVTARDLKGESYL